MGQKTHPYGVRIRVNRLWDSMWYAGRRDYAKKLAEDLRLRAFLEKRLANVGLSRVLIERSGTKVCVTVYASRPGLIIGKQGEDIKRLREEVARLVTGELSFNVLEVRKPDLDARILADGVASQLQRRVSFRRAMKRTIQNAMKAGALGIRINCSGRLGGAEIARTEWYREGRVPLQSLRSDISFFRSTAYTTYGTCGIKVWVYTGDIMEYDPTSKGRGAATPEKSSRSASRGG